MSRYISALLLTACCALWSFPLLSAQADEPPADLLTETQTDVPPTSILDSLQQTFAVHGALRQETAYRVGHSGEWTKIRQQVQLSESGALTDDLKFYASQRGRYDAVYDLTDNYPETVESDQEWESDVRETYLDYSSGEMDVRLGKQQIVWGDAVGLFFADVVNAKDLREFILPDFDQIRIPQWAVDLELSHDDAHAEFVWLPVREFHHLGVSGSEFEFPLPAPVGARTNYTDPSKPAPNMASSEAGLRLSYLLGGWDMSAFYFYTWDKFPVLYRSITGGVYDFMPEYRRANLLGASFSKALGEVVLKGEAVLNPQAYLSTLDPTDPDGVLHRTTLDYLVGADYTWFDRVETNVQILQRVVSHLNDSIPNEKEWRTHLSVRAKTDFLNGKVEPECLIIFGLSEWGDLMIRPKVTTRLRENLEWRVGADILQGEPTSVFGRFNRNSRLYTELSYHF